MEPGTVTASDITADASWLTSTTRRLVECDSTVGYYAQIEPLISDMLAECGLSMWWDRKHTGYVRLEGVDHAHCVCMGAHLDTIGLVVRGFNDDGTLRVRKLGGVNYASAEGEGCRIHCRDGRTVEGQVICNHHSVHVFEDARTMERDDDHMSVSIVGDVSCPEDARALGVTQGAIVSIDPHFVSYDNGFIASRHLDDKACVAALIGMTRWFHETGTKPAVDTLLAFPIYEEIGHGGTFVPDEVEEYVALDISLIGPDYDSNEHQVGIVAADFKGPYDWDLTNRLITEAASVCPEGSWNTQVAFHFSTDAMAAYVSGSNLAAGAFGPACLNSHGRERMHVDAIVETQRLATAYACGMGR
jgi:putative aminopeptidase FrvX